MAVAKCEYWLSKEGLLLLESWARDGLTDEQISKNMGITRTTLYNWKKKHIDILNTLKKGKDIVDYEVEKKLLERAMGYDYTEDIIIKRRNQDGSEVAEVKQIKRYKHPDTTAIIFWLKNRRPEKWRDKHQIVNEDMNKLDEMFRAIDLSSKTFIDDGKQE